MKLVILFAFLTLSFPVWADPIPPSWDEDRLKGFAEHRAAGRIHDREREKAHAAFNEEVEQWERQRKAAAEAHRRRQKNQSFPEGGPEHLKWLRQEALRKKEQEETRITYVKRRDAVQKGKKKRPLSEAEELGLDESRPRYELGKRALYGAPTKFKTGGASIGGGYSGGGGSSPAPSPPPANFDEFPAGDGYVPPPPMPEDDGSDFPPPPPAPSFEEGGDFPPPPDFGDFPPPPPPMEDF